MKGYAKYQGPNRWSLIFDLGYVVGEAGKRKRKQKWIAFHGTRKQAEAKLTELVRAANRNEFVEPSKLTLIDWLRTWVDTSVKPPMRRPETYRVYASIINTHMATSPVALIPLQRLRASDLERYYADVKAAPASLSVHHAILHRALKKAVKDRLLTVNPAVDLERRRPTTDPATSAREHCWSAVEARRVIEAAKSASPQLSAFVFLALDTGARKSELHGLGWEHVDLDAGTLTIARQLDKAGVTPVFGPTKTKHTRTVSLTPETIARLRAHRGHQTELKMKNRTVYQDFGLVFAKEPEDLQTPTAALGQPLKMLSEGRFKSLVKQADVKLIKFHGVRHTCATLSLQAGTPPHVVAAKLGHSVLELMKTYAHALPNMQQDAAVRLGALLHG